MVQLRDIRQRIGGIKNTQKITRAMKMIAAMKLLRAQKKAVEARPYFEAMQHYIASLAPQVAGASFPLMVPRKINTVLWVVITSDRGLCGGLNINLLRSLEARLRFDAAAGREATILAVGRKGAGYLARRGYPPLNSMVHRGPEKAVELSEEITALAEAAFLKGECDQVILVYNHFVSTVRYRPQFLPFLPLGKITEEAEEKIAGGRYNVFDYLFEPEPARLIENFLPHYLATTVYQVLLETYASEFAARLISMDQATSNAERMIGDLTLVYHKARQAAITREIIEVVSAGEALR